MQSCFSVPQFSGSFLKSSVVAAYFSHWAKVVAPYAKKVGNKIGFLDFYSGSGKNEDGSEPTPLHVLRCAVESEEIANLLVPVFCDKESKNLIKLKQTLAHIDGVEVLAHAPLFEKGATYEDLICCMHKIRLLPSLIAIDPFNIKDLNLSLFFNYVNEGNIDCFFQIQYNLLERIIDNPFKARHLETIFGKTAADMLRTVSDRLNLQQKERLIVNTFLESFKGYHSIVLRNEQESDVCYLVFVTRYVPRYRFMKELMIKKGYLEIGSGNIEIGQAEKRKVSVQAGLFN